MKKPAIEVMGLGKVYNIGHEQKAAAGTMTFRDTLTGFAKKPIELLTGHRLEKEQFWALRDVDFQVNRGEVIGIIGRNGSGKSTLLKILSRIVEPTEGEVVMRGRVASLLEVGTGFHPELTGRENIYFNGAILGMSRKEIKAKFDEIVSFSEVEKFLDTPVKFYSSGMYVRLAFAVAAHLEPDILIVDEVLAVGDAAFQKKCLGKMRDVANDGRTVLFVSHSMPTIQSLCTQGILMKHGKIMIKGEIQDVIDQYIGVNQDNPGIFDNFQKRREGSHDIRIESIKLRQKNEITSHFDSLDSISAELNLAKTINGSRSLRIDCNIHNSQGTWVMCLTGAYHLINTNKIQFKLPSIDLSQGQYTANISILENGNLQDFIPDAISFSIKSSKVMLTGVSGVVFGELRQDDKS